MNIQPGMSATKSSHPSNQQHSVTESSKPHNEDASKNHGDLINDPAHLKNTADSDAGAATDLHAADSHATDPHAANEEKGHPTSSLNTEKIANYLLGIVVFIGLIAILWISSRPIGKSSANNFDLLSIKPLAKIVRLKYLRLILQLVNVTVFFIIIYLGFFGIQIATQSVTYSLTWYFWWPIFFLLILFMGRIWCMVCPFAALADWVQKVVNFNKKFPKKLQNLWVATILFLMAMKLAPQT